MSHRVLRWTITPICLFALIPLNTILVLSGAGTVYTVIWILQILFYAAATFGIRIPAYFVFMNLNVFRGMAYLLNNSTGMWEKAKRA